MACNELGPRESSRYGFGMRHIPAQILAIGFVATLVAGCAPSFEEPEPSAAQTTAAASSSTPTPADTASPTSQPSASSSATVLSCDTLLTPEADADLRAQGLVPTQKDRFTIFYDGLTLPAVECPWGPPDGHDENVVTYYGWAELSAGQKREIIDVAGDYGYTTRDVEGGTELVPDPNNGPPATVVYVVTEDWFAIAPSVEEVSNIAWAS